MYRLGKLQGKLPLYESGPRGKKKNKQTIVGIFIFISRESFMPNCVEHEKKFYNLGTRAKENH